VIEGKPDELVARMTSEGENSPADLFIAADAGALWRAQQAGPVPAGQFEVLAERIPANLREPEGNWYGFTRRARVVAYDPAKVQPEEIDDYAKLAGPRFRGKICVRSSDSVYNLSLVGALIEAWGRGTAGEWVRGIVANMARPPEGGDRDQIRAVAAGRVRSGADQQLLLHPHGQRATMPADREVTQKVSLGLPQPRRPGRACEHFGRRRGCAMRPTATMPSLARIPRLGGIAAAHLANNNEYPASPDVPAPAPVDAYAKFTAHPMGVAFRRPAAAGPVADERGGLALTACLILPAGAPSAGHRPCLMAACRAIVLLPLAGVVLAAFGRARPTSPHAILPAMP
jgi:iron(III) transport system substrate-binding protein